MYRRDWQRLRTAFPHAAIVVAGDFNQSLVDWHNYGSRRKRDLLEKALAKAGLAVVTAGANDPVAREAAPHACIDHICISADSCLRAEPTTRWPQTTQPDRRLSDHFGIAVELSRR